MMESMVVDVVVAVMVVAKSNMEGRTGCLRLFAYMKDTPGPRWLWIYRGHCI